MFIFSREVHFFILRNELCALYETRKILKFMVSKHKILVYLYLHENEVFKVRNSLYEV